MEKEPNSGPMVILIRAISSKARRSEKENILLSMEVGTKEITTTTA